MAMSYSEDYKIRVSSCLDRMAQLFADINNKGVEKLDKEVARLISASKLEGHDEIAAIAQNIKNITEALHTGKLLPTDSINSTLKEAIDQVRGNMEDRF